MTNSMRKAHAQNALLLIGSLCFGLEFGWLVGIGVFSVGWALQPYAT